MTDKTLITFDVEDDWRTAAEARGLAVRKHEREDMEDVTELFAESDDDDVTMIGYFSEGWGMLT